MEDFGQILVGFLVDFHVFHKRNKGAETAYKKKKQTDGGTISIEHI
jgi:hypothetical protein